MKWEDVQLDSQPNGITISFYTSLYLVLQGDMARYKKKWEDIGDVGATQCRETLYLSIPHCI